jgi:hypothetical protein
MERLTPDHVGSMVPVMFFSSTVLKTEQSITLCLLAHKMEYNSANLHKTEEEYYAQTPLRPFRQLYFR